MVEGELKEAVNYDASGLPILGSSLRNLHYNQVPPIRMRLDGPFTQRAARAGDGTLQPALKAARLPMRFHP
jgi:hypothetical protein